MQADLSKPIELTGRYPPIPTKRFHRIDSAPVNQLSDPSIGAPEIVGDLPNLVQSPVSPLPMSGWTLP
jgi:hypothetical protein